MSRWVWFGVGTVVGAALGIGGLFAGHHAMQRAYAKAVWA